MKNNSSLLRPVLPLLLATSGAVSASSVITDFEWFTDGALVNTYSGDPNTVFTFTVSENGSTTNTTPFLSDFRPFGTDLVVANLGGNQGQALGDPSNPITITHTLTFSSPVTDLRLVFGGALNDRDNAGQLMDEYLFNFSIAPTSVTSLQNAWDPVTGRLDADSDVSLADTFIFEGPISELSFDYGGYGTPNGMNLELNTLQWTSVPEPSTAIMSLALGGLSLLRRRR